jgi:hypothetical protein
VITNLCIDFLGVGFELSRRRDKRLGAILQHRKAHTIGAGSRFYRAKALRSRLPI